MCLIFLSVNQHPQYPLIIAANRDEFYARKTAPAAFWPAFPHVLAGRDLQAGGTWLGITRQGRFAMITNYRDPKLVNASAPSRGALVADFLIDNESPIDYARRVKEGAERYNGFNLIVGEGSQICYLSNMQHSIQTLKDGTYGLSNHLLDTPWPKVQRGLTEMTKLLKEDQIDPEAIFSFMADTTKAEDAQLPNTGLSLERERALSSLFIDLPNYGTRSTTIIFRDTNNKVLFSERTFEGDNPPSTQRYEFSLE